MLIVRQQRVNIALTYINVKVGDQLGGDVNAALLASAGRQIRVTVPATADWVGIGSGRGRVLDAGGGYYANGFT